MNTKEISQIQGFIEAIPKHECAYCGSKKTDISQEVKFSGEHVVCFSIQCLDCGREDCPAITKDRLKAILRFC
jgi:hypothetical protein